MSSESGVGVYFHPASTICEARVSSHKRLCRSQDARKDAGRQTHLLHLALPTFLALVGPAADEGLFAGVHHVGGAGVVGAVVAQAGLNGADDGPAAAVGEAQVLLEGIVGVFPATDALEAQVADDIVGKLGGRLKVEASASKLQQGAVSIVTSRRHQCGALQTRTASGSSRLFGQDSDLGPFVAFVDTERRRLTGWAFWKVARRPSNV